MFPYKNPLSNLVFMLFILKCLFTPSLCNALQTDWQNTVAVGKQNPFTVIWFYYHVLQHNMESVFPRWLCCGGVICHKYWSAEFHVSRCLWSNYHMREGSVSSFSDKFVNNSSVVQLFSPYLKIIQWPLIWDILYIIFFSSL